jgi:hypothetical protein
VGESERGNGNGQLRDETGDGGWTQRGKKRD